MLTTSTYEPWVYMVTFVVACVAIFVPYIRKVVEWFVTIIHEVGHGVLSVLTGGGIRSIKLHRDGSGVTATSHKVNLFFRITRLIVLFAGYAAPIYTGIGLLILVRVGLAQLAFYILVGVGLVTLIFIRNWFGIFIIATYFVTLGAGILLQKGHLVPLFVVFFGALFLIRGIYDLIIAGKLVITGNYSGDEGTDFHILSSESLFRLPAIVWYIIYVLLNIFVITIIVINLVTRPEILGFATLFRFPFPELSNFGTCSLLVWVC